MLKIIIILLYPRPSPSIPGKRRTAVGSVRFFVCERFASVVSGGSSLRVIEVLGVKDGEVIQGVFPSYDAPLPILGLVS